MSTKTVAALARGLELAVAAKNSPYVVQNMDGGKDALSNHRLFMQHHTPEYMIELYTTIEALQKKNEQLERDFKVLWSRV